MESDLASSKDNFQFRNENIQWSERRSWAPIPPVNINKIVNQKTNKEFVQKNRLSVLYSPDLPKVTNLLKNQKN
jgi:hypothetical protein